MNYTLQEEHKMSYSFVKNLVNSPTESKDFTNSEYIMYFWGNQDSSNDFS